MSLAEQKRAFLASAAFAVVGASANPSKFGHRVYVSYLRHGRKAYPVNPTATTILGNRAFPDLVSLPVPVEAVSIVTRPAVTERVVDDAIAAGVKHLWMQPGAESAEAVRKAEAAGISVIHGGPCILVELG
jgi:uncharacterized protein